MVRGGVVLLILGVVLGYYATQELRVSSGSQGEPLTVDLAKLEACETPESNYVRVGEHLPSYNGAVYRTTKQSGNQVAPTTPISYCYYPIISTSHPFTQAMRRLQTGEVQNGVPEIPELSNFRVLVRSHRFDAVGEIPDTFTTCASVDGLIINRISPLAADEANLIKKSFPKLNLDEVLILEEDRKPTSMWAGIAMMVGAFALAGGGIGLIVLAKKAAALDNNPTLS